MKLHHIGYLVKNMEKALESFGELGFGVSSSPCSDGLRGADIAFLEKDGCVIELVSPNRADSVVSGLMKTRKNSPYHLCFETEDLDGDLASLLSKGYVQAGEILPAPALGGLRAAFLVSSKIGLIELIGV